MDARFKATQLRGPPTAEPGLTSRSGGGPLVLQAEDEPVERELEEQAWVVAHEDTRRRLAGRNAQSDLISPVR
jgi:hypothetical protein